MRLLYIVTYDISDAKRWRRVFRIMNGYGDHLQYSVFRCELSDRERVEMVMRLSEVLKLTEDQLLLFPLGPADGMHAQGVYTLGRAYKPSIHEAVII